MRTVRTLSIIAALSVSSVAGAGAPAAGQTPPPMPTLVNVRYARHDGFDRVVFDWRGAAPGWKAAYGTLVGEGTGTPIALTGNADLVIRFFPARAHDDAGRPTYKMTTVLNPALPQVKQIKFGGDFEGYVTVGIGVGRRTGFKVFTLSSPPRVVVDISSSWTC